MTIYRARGMSTLTPKSRDLRAVPCLAVPRRRAVSASDLENNGPPSFRSAKTPVLRRYVRTISLLYKLTHVQGKTESRSRETLKPPTKVAVSRSDASRQVESPQPTKGPAAMTADPSGEHPILTEDPVDQSQGLSIQEVEIYAEEGLTQQQIYMEIAEAQIEQVIQQGGVQPAGRQQQLSDESDEGTRREEQVAEQTTEEAAAGASLPQ